MSRFTSRILPILLAALVCLGTLVVPMSAHADEPTPDAPTTTQADQPPTDTPATTQPPVSVQPAQSTRLIPFLPDPKVWAGEVFNAVLVNLLQKLADALHTVVNGVLSSNLNFISQTPPAGSYDSPTVGALWGVTRAIANAALVLIVLWSGFNLIAREGFGASYPDMVELLPRLIFGALMANTSLIWGKIAIDANNALCSAIGGTTLPAWERADLGSQVLADLVAAVIYLVTSLLLLLQMLARLALIDILLVAAPIALMCWALPQTQGWTRLWSNLFLATVFTQFVQVLALKLGGSLLTELTPMAFDSALLSLFLGVAVMVLILKIPGLMRNHLGSGMGFVRYVVYRRAAQGLEGGSAADRAATGGQ
ncbi:MAG: hypothetical protein U0822_17005 [Anaerolineae bacterium]